MGIRLWEVLCKSYGKVLCGGLMGGSYARVLCDSQNQSPIKRVKKNADQMSHSKSYARSYAVLCGPAIQLVPLPFLPPSCPCEAFLPPASGSYAEALCP